MVADLILPVLIILIAGPHGAVGHAGASSYTAVMALCGSHQRCSSRPR